MSTVDVGSMVLQLIIIFFKYFLTIYKKIFGRRISIQFEFNKILVYDCTQSKKSLF